VERGRADNNARGTRQGGQRCAWNDDGWDRQEEEEEMEEEEEEQQ
jgi:hypothetical protein